MENNDMTRVECCGTILSARSASLKKRAAGSKGIGMLCDWMAGNLGLERSKFE